MKKVLALLLCVLMTVSMLCCTALAEPAKGKELKNLNADVNNANRQIKQLIRMAQATEDDDVDEMLAQVDAIVARVQQHAADEGAVVICTMEEYYIDGRWVSVDPLMVVNIRQ